MSATTHPRQNFNSISLSRFNILRKIHNIPSFVVEMHLLLLLFSFPFFSQLFNFPVNLLHFTSKLFTTHHKAYLPSPPSKLSLYNPTVISPLYSLLLAQKPAHFFFFTFISHFNSSVIHARLRVPSLDLAASSLFPCPLWSLCRPSFSDSVWCVSLWSFCATVHPVDRKHPVHHHSQLPVGSAGSVWPICVIFCQITGVWLYMIHPSPNHLPGEKGREAGERKVQVGALHWAAQHDSSVLGGSLVLILALFCSPGITIHCF